MNDTSPAQPQDAEQRSGAQDHPGMGVALIRGTTFEAKPVTYLDIGGIAVVEGDVALGPVAEIERQTAQAQRRATEGGGVTAHSIAISGPESRWPDGVVPYEIDPALPDQERVTEAVAHWEAETPLRFPVRTEANAAEHENYVRFTDADGCWSSLGMQGGEQLISLGPGCNLGNAIHEIAHAVGMWHEQSREDRDLFVTIQWQNIKDGMSAQFHQHIQDGDDIGPYDYGSIMHYPPKAFSRNGQDTIVPVDPNAGIGQRDGLSSGDIAGVAAIYPELG
jgi:Astacin (Peptidase family M12A)